MSSDLGVGQPVDSPEKPFDAITEQAWAVSDYIWWLKPVLSMVLGVALGAENLLAPEAAGLLRIPALLAALILFAQGPIYWDEHAHEKAIKAKRVAAERQRREEQQRAETEAEADDPELAQRIPRLLPDESAEPETATMGEGKEPERQVQEHEASRSTAGAVAESRGGLLTVLILAIWLGLATLNYSNAPASLLWLSLIAAFLLFMSSWGMLLRPRPV
jgi:hypothetical protein